MILLYNELQWQINNSVSPTFHLGLQEELELGTHAMQGLVVVVDRRPVLLEPRLQTLYTVYDR